MPGFSLEGFTGGSGDEFALRRFSLASSRRLISATSSISFFGSCSFDACSHSCCHLSCESCIGPSPDRGKCLYHAASCPLCSMPDTVRHRGPERSKDMERKTPIIPIQDRKNQSKRRKRDENVVRLRDCTVTYSMYPIVIWARDLHHTCSKAKSGICEADPDC